MADKNYQHDESFRDRLSTVTEEGKRLWIYAKKPFGKLHNYRVIVSVILLAFFFIVPFIKVNGEPFLLINFLERKFILFGVIFWPQDSYLFVLMMLSFMIFIILFTVVYGRIWCGWACPQTIFMEMIFRKIEYIIEGDAPKQRKLDKQPWNLEKITKKAIKHAVFFAIAILITNTLLAYVIGIDELRSIVFDDISNHLSGFIIMLIFSAGLYLIYAFFREQVCIIVCPYGRLQGVLLDSKSIVVSYDYQRGEPRGKLKKGENRAEAEKGDCIDCKLCYQVCPTGIDIRNGTQLECINCTACIDACNQSMKRVDLPENLIKLSSEKDIAEGHKKMQFTPRMIAYTIVLVGILTFLSVLLISRPAVETTILRTAGQLYQPRGTDSISNLYNVIIVNKTHEDLPIDIRLASHDGRIEIPKGQLEVEDHGSVESVFFVILSREDVQTEKVPVEFDIYSGDTKLEDVKATFVGPNINE